MPVGAENRMHKHNAHEDAFTGLELVVTIIVLVLSAYGLMTIMSSDTGSHDTRTGIIPTITGESGYAMRHVGQVMVFASVDGTPANVIVHFPRQDSSRMGAAEMTVALFIGNMGGIDFDTVDVIWGSNGVTEQIPRKDTRPLNCPGWTIAGKYNMLPFKTADSDNILEPNEQFEIFVCPSNTTVPYEKFSVTIDHPGQVLPPVVIATAPPMTTAVVTLS